MKNYIINIYKNFREWCWKYRKETLHVVPETRY